jgi:acyl-[acyl-carrier-protein]-phospholipid O-acyltransferase/long-chain-fatty-acid--[acyl-carrier-protein] ligase
VSSAVIASCAGQCGITKVITSQKFLDKVPIQVPGDTILLEDVKASVTGKDRIVAMLMAIFLPVRLLEKALGATPRTENDLATVIFSSGSEGEPKGVLLTHRNVMGNVEGALEVFPHHKHSSLIGFLPFFHSFGYMATLWLPLTHGMGGIFHANPLEPKVIGDLVQKYHGTIFLGSSTFLQGFIRRCLPEQLASLEFVVCGAEKLAPRVRIAFAEKFGCEPLEGYGTTECAPAVAVNVPDCASPGFFYRGTTHGTIGRVVPGVSVRIIDPDTGERLPLGEAGVLHTKGVNIMRGYLDQPEKTASVLQDGWYNTGDIAKVDEEGFITITDRLSRFSKIGGEMVPHNRVEEVLHGLLGLTDQSLAVAGVPDRAKGERLVVLHILDDEQLKTLLAKLPGCDLPNLYVPRPGAFHRIEAIPVLGSGKMDIKMVRKLALELGSET